MRNELNGIAMDLEKIQYDLSKFEKQIDIADEGTLTDRDISLFTNLQMAAMSVGTAARCARNAATEARL